MTSHFTRCPQCRTTFRITSQQLALREGLARCGHCRTVFNAFTALVNFQGERVPGPGMEEQRETMTLRDSVSAPESDFSASPSSSAPPEARAPEAIPRPHPASKISDALRSSLRTATYERFVQRSSERAPLAIAEKPEEKSFPQSLPHEDRSLSLSLVLDPTKKPTVWQRLNLPPWSRPLFYLISLPGLALLLAAQFTFFMHDELAHAYPRLKPMLSQGCRWLGCEVNPLQNLGALTIEASDLQSGAFDERQLLLTLTLRNRSDKPVAYPSLLLELTDEHGKLLSRRYFAPDTYLVHTADANAGIPTARDLVLRLLLHSGLAASGYRLSLVYP
jgi:predicted Zn finger-like uncharacterized protein